MVRVLRLQPSKLQKTPIVENSELARCKAEQRDIESTEGPAWLKALGWADWEAEKELIRRESAPVAAATRDLLKDRRHAAFPDPDHCRLCRVLPAQRREVVQPQKHDSESANCQPDEN